jgi:hypothetical protein
MHKILNKVIFFSQNLDRALNDKKFAGNLRGSELVNFHRWLIEKNLKELEDELRASEENNNRK